MLLSTQGTVLIEGNGSDQFRPLRHFRPLPLSKIKGGAHEQKGGTAFRKCLPRFNSE